MQLVSVEDMDFLAQQSSGKLNMIVSGMTALLNDNDSKVAQLESQNWFQRMVKTVTGKNKATQEEIRLNHDALNAYMSEAIAELYNRNLLDHEIILSLGTQINELYADHIQLKQMLGAFAAKLNEKMESIDNYHLLVEEIGQGFYSTGRSLSDICRVISQLDHRTLNDGRKLGILRRGLVSQGILSDEQIGLKEYLAQVLAIPSDYVGRIYLELGTIRRNFMAGIILAMMDDYYFLPDLARKMKNKPAMIASVIESERLDEGVTLSTSEIYDDFINSKIDAMNGLVHVVSDEPVEPVTPVLPSADFDEDTEDPDEIRIAAEAGVPEAQDMLGDIYYIEEDYAQAVKWYRKAAEQGYAQAQCDLGLMYESGFGVSEDYEEAVRWYRKAAEQGLADAQDMLGVMYDNGRGVEENDVKAVEWYRKAAEQDLADAQYRLAQAQYNLGTMYQNGKGVRKDKSEARKWYSKAAEQGHEDAKKALS